MAKRQITVEMIDEFTDEPLLSMNVAFQHADAYALGGLLRAFQNSPNVIPTPQGYGVYHSAGRSEIGASMSRFGSNPHVRVDVSEVVAKAPQHSGPKHVVDPVVNQPVSDPVVNEPVSDPVVDPVVNETGPTGSGIRYADPHEVVYTTYVSGQGHGVGIQSGFNIELTFNGDSWTPELQSYFINAAEYVSSLIVQDVIDHTKIVYNGEMNWETGEWIATSAEPGETIDDIRIWCDISNLDGIGGIESNVGASSLRTEGDFLPYEGCIQHDIADASLDIQSGSFDDIILQNILQALGMGNQWEYKGLVTRDGSGVANYTGQELESTMVEIAPVSIKDLLDDGSGLIDINKLLNNSGIPGQDGQYFSNSIVGNEVMTQGINDGSYVSAATLAALTDMGYATINPTNWVIE